MSNTLKYSSRSTISNSIKGADYYRKTLDNVALIAITDLNGVLIQVNAMFCKITGYSEEELIGKNYEFLNSGYHTNLFFKSLYGQLAKEKTWTGELNIKTKNKSHIWLNMAISSVKADNCQSEHFLVIGFDNTNKKEKENQYLENIKRSERRATEQNEFKSKILYILSHDVKTPLKSLDGLLYLLTRGDLPFDELVVLVNDIRKKISKTDTFIDNLLSLAENHYLKRNAIKEVRLEDVLDNICGFFRNELITKKIKLKPNFNHTSKIRSNTELITIIVRNFISNAIKFSYPETNIEIETLTTDKSTVIKVIDFGVGMDQNSLDTINSKTKISTMGTNGECGSGIGILISRDLIHDLGGTFKVESKKDTGSTFSFSIPHGVEISYDE
ncbi:MAG: PAS domain S-box protein [Cyclobacteriaceae bacterium]|nr:PAS domain S-box protein [Cyclobacteriaceae bacterium]